MKNNQIEEIRTTPRVFIFLKRFLLHAFIVWLAVNIGSGVVYVYKIKLDLVYTVNSDGSLVSFMDSFIRHNVEQPLCLWILLIAFLAELNFQYIFQQKGLLWFVLSSIFLGIAGGAISLLFTEYVPFYPVMAQFIEAALFITGYVAVYAILYNFFYERYQRAKYHQKKSESELHLLKAQINPHFFFNTLNNLYGIALKEKAMQTANGVELLSDMMRYNMTGVREDFVRAEAELKFIENYLALQQLRVPERSSIVIKTEIVYPAVNYRIAPMLLIPLIENAWKYGISIDKPSFITLKIAVENHTLIMVIENSVFAGDDSNGGSGLGISNVKQRLQLIYPERHQLSISADAQSYRANLSIIL